MLATGEVICITLSCLLAVYVVVLLCAMTVFGQFQEYITQDGISVFFWSKSSCMRCSLASLIFGSW